MKQQIQENGVRKWFGDDFIALQDELIEAMTAIFADHGNFIISGCTVADLGATWQVDAGIVLLRDDAGDNPKICRYAGGIFNTAVAQIYLTQSALDKDDVPAYGRLYKDAATKNIVVDYIAVASTSTPAQADYIIISKTTGGETFLDSIQNANRRFVTDALISSWNAKFDIVSGVPIADVGTGSNYTQSVNVSQNLNVAKDKTDLDLTQIIPPGATQTSNYTLHASAGLVYAKITVEVISTGAGTINVIHEGTTLFTVTVSTGTRTRYFFARRVGAKWIKIIHDAATSPQI